MVFYSVCYSNGQVLNVLHTSVEIFKYQKLLLHLCRKWAWVWPKYLAKKVSAMEEFFLTVRSGCVY